MVGCRASSAMTGSMKPFNNCNFDFASRQRPDGQCIFNKQFVYTNFRLPHCTKTVIIRLRRGAIPARIDAETVNFRNKIIISIACASNRPPPGTVHGARPPVHQRTAPVGAHDGVEAPLAGPLGGHLLAGCLLYTSPSPRDRQKSRMPSSA